MILFVWDLHGVLEKGNDIAVLEISNKVLENFGYFNRFTKEQAFMLSGLKWFEYFEFLLPEESHEKHLQLQEACFNMSNSQPDIIARHIQKTDHILDILEAIKQKHAQILISNTKPESLRWYISVLDLGAYFNDENTFAVDGHSKQPAKTKRDILQAFLKDKKFESIIIISDNIKDRAMSDIANSKFIQYRHTEMKTSESSQINDIREIMKYV